MTTHICCSENIVGNFDCLVRVDVGDRDCLVHVGATRIFEHFVCRYPLELGLIL